MHTWTKKENHFNIGLSIVSKVEGKQEIVGRHAGSGKHRVLSGVRKAGNYLNKMCQVFHEVHSNLRANSERETNSDIHLC